MKSQASFWFVCFGFLFFGMFLFLFFVSYKKENYPKFQQSEQILLWTRRICQDPFNSCLQKYHKTSNLPLQSVNQTDPKLDLNLTLFSHLISLVLHFFLPHSLLKQLTS